MSATKKREIASRTPTPLTHTPLLNESEQKRLETSRSGGNMLELSDIGQEYRSKSVIRLDKSQTTSSYKSSSVTGPQETQETMTFAVSEIATKISKSSISGDHEEEESSTAQFEPPKPKSFKEPDDDKRAQAYQTAISVANSRPNYSPVSPLLPNQPSGWKAVVQKIQNQANKNMSNPPQAQPEMMGTPSNQKGIAMSKGLSSLIEACNVKNSTNFVKVSFQQQLNISPKSPIGVHGGVIQNISLTSSIGKFNKHDQLTKAPVKEPIDQEKVHQAPLVPSFKDYLQMHKSPVSMPDPKQSTESLRLLQAYKSKRNVEAPLRRGSAGDAELIRKKNEEAQSRDLTPPKETDEKMKERLLDTPVKQKKPNTNQTLISTTFKSPQIQILNQIAMPLNREKEKANLRGFPSGKGSSVKKTNLVPDLPIISEVPEINLKPKKVVNQSKQGTQQSVKSGQRSGSFDHLEIGSVSPDSGDESESNGESNEASEGSGQDLLRRDEVSQVHNQNVENIQIPKPRHTEMMEETQGTSEMSEEEGGEESGEDSGSGEGYEEDEEDSGETGTSEGIETQRVEKFRSACAENTFREHVINSPQEKSESEYEEETSEEGDDDGSSEYLLTEGDYESTQGGETLQFLSDQKIGREKYQQINQQLVFKPGVNQMKQLERNPGHNRQIHESALKNVNESEKKEDVSRNRMIKDESNNLDDILFKSNTMSSTDLIFKKYDEIEYKVWDLKGNGKQWMLDKEVRIMQVSLKSLSERLDSLFELAEGRPSKKDAVLSLTSSELNQIFEDLSQSY